MSLRDIKGQPFAVKLLKGAVESGRLAHTYLFYGPEGAGKEQTARQFAKVLNCTEKTQDSCDQCSSCTRIEQNKHPDISWIYPIGKGRQIRIEQVRQLQRFVSLKAYEGKVKVSIIVDAHTLNIEAGNALLKTLEEPPPNSVFVLVTHSPETLLPTIKSRTQDVQFFYLPHGTTSEFREFIIDIMAEGSFRGMVDLMDKVGEIQGRLERFKERLEEQLGEEEDEVDEAAYIAGEYRKQAEEILGLILSWYRDILVYKNTHREEMVFNKDYMDRIQYWESRLSIDELTSKIDIVGDIKEALARQVGLKLLLQVMFVELGMIKA